MKVVFVTMYDESARGARWIAASAQQAGHEIVFIHVKNFRSLTIPRHDTERLEWAIAQSPFQVREVTHEGERFHPFPAPITDTERRLFAGLIEQHKPDVVGLTFATHAFEMAVELTELIRQTRPGIPIAWGGVHAIIDPEGCIQHADVVCPGEGEEAFLEYLADPSRTDVAGLWFRTPNGPIRNPVRPLLQDLDALPWPVYGGDEYDVTENQVSRQIVEEPNYIRFHFYTETTRGCPYGCTYCIHSTCRTRYIGQKYVRMRSPENVVAEIQAFRRRFGLQPVLPLFDEILLANKKRFGRFAELYRREIGHPFCGFAHHQTTDRELLEMARDSGIAETSIGVQTGSERIARDIYNRPIDREAIVRLARAIHEVGAGRLVINVLCDCAFEEEQDLRDTFELLLDMPRPFLIQLSRVVPFPNTPLAQMPCETPPLPRHVREFWNLMYLLTQNVQLNVETLRGLALDPYLRERPEILDRLTFSVFSNGGFGVAEPAAGLPAIESRGTGGLTHKITRLYQKLKRRVASFRR